MAIPILIDDNCMLCDVDGDNTLAPQGKCKLFPPDAIESHCTATTTISALLLAGHTPKYITKWPNLGNTCDTRYQQRRDEWHELSRLTQSSDEQDRFEHGVWRHIYKAH